MNAALPSACGGCAQHRTDSLLRLGLNPDKWDILVALAGNPNVGKSTVFNALTGLRQHTGNWPGKTIARAEGAFAHEGQRVKIVDLPGTYSLQAGSTDEEVARDFILFGRPDVTVVVVDATRLERNLNLALQILDITDRVVVYLNLVDEARRHGIAVDAARLEKELGVPVVSGVARTGVGIDDLLSASFRIASGAARTRPYRVEELPAGAEATVTGLTGEIEEAFPSVPNARWVALRLLNADDAVVEVVRSGELGQLGDSLPAGGDGDADDRPPPPPAERERVLRTARRLRWELPADFHDSLTERTYSAAQRIADGAQMRGLKKAGFDLDRTLDRLLTSRWLGFPCMLAILATVFWDHDRGRQRAVRNAGVAADRHRAPLAEGPRRRGRQPLVAERVPLRRRLPGDGVGGCGHAAADGHLLPALHPARGLRLPAPGGLQPRRSLPLGRRARQAGADHVHGIRVQRGGRRVDAGHRQPARAAHRHPDEQLLALQRPLADPKS